MLLSRNDHVLFFGDSITDCGRCETVNNPEQMGTGYAAMCAASLLAKYPEMNLRFTNRGIGGDRVYDLQRRLQADVLAEKPTLVSILVGINDTWQRYGENLQSPLENFEAAYRDILTQIRDELGARLVICEPFCLPVAPVTEQWREDIDPKIASIRRLADEFDAAYIACDEIFAKAATRQSMEYWLFDGVHPSSAGHMLIAEAWLEATTRDGTER